MKIRLANLHDGVNEIHHKYTIGEMGFENDAEKLSLFPNFIFVDVEIQKMSDRYFVKTKLKTAAHFSCDRCLEEFDQALKNSFQIYFTKKIENQEENEDYRFLDDKTEEIDLTDTIVEYLLLALPMKKICEAGCQGLCPECGTNLNDSKCNCRHETIDPRWEILKNISITD